MCLKCWVVPVLAALFLPQGSPKAVPLDALKQLVELVVAEEVLGGISPAGRVESDSLGFVEELDSSMEDGLKIGMEQKRSFPNFGLPLDNLSLWQARNKQRSFPQIPKPRFSAPLDRIGSSRLSSQRLA
eukprot:gi/632968050/ref/XP_007900317.1/ PREDICTED: osteocrin-like [Callorhinchus milii]